MAFLLLIAPYIIGIWISELLEFSERNRVFTTYAISIFFCVSLLVYGISNKEQ